MTKHTFLKALGISTLILSIILLISYNIINTKPDLIIENVTYELKWSDTSTGDSIVYAEYTIRVKNIGNAPANGSFHAEWTHTIFQASSDRDIQNNHYSRGQMLKYTDSSPIRPNETFVGKVQDISPEVGTVRFIINNPNPDLPTSAPNSPDVTTHPNKVNLPEIDESNFNNNTYTLTLK
ncbi:MAG: hypothetical protein WC369_05890 [Dehalococcoidales bacterium]